MKLHKPILFVVVLLMVVPAVSFSSEGSTLLLMPREEEVVKVGLDVGNRFSTILLSYKIVPSGQLSLHGWSGKEWVNVTPESYAEGSFYTVAPVSAVLVAEEGVEIPEQLIPGAAWCPEVYRIATVETRPLIHLLGRHYDFKYKDWKWFSENYQLPLDCINPDGLNVAWYHRRMVDNMKAQGTDSYSDLNHLRIIRMPELASEQEPVEVADETDAVAPEESVDPVADEDVAEESNPLTNDVPQAVVMGDGAPEEGTMDNATDEELEPIDQE